MLTVEQAQMLVGLIATPDGVHLTLTAWAEHVGGCAEVRVAATRPECARVLQPTNGHPPIPVHGHQGWAAAHVTPDDPDDWPTTLSEAALTMLDRVTTAQHHAFAAPHN